MLHAQTPKLWSGYNLSDTLAVVVHVWRSAKAGALLGLPGARVLLIPGADAAGIPCILPCVLVPAAFAILQCPHESYWIGARTPELYLAAPCGKLAIVHSPMGQAVGSKPEQWAGERYLLASTPVIQHHISNCLDAVGVERFDAPAQVCLRPVRRVQALILPWQVPLHMSLLFLGEVHGVPLTIVAIFE